MGQKPSQILVLKPGDHICVSRAAGFYHRHGIYISEEMVIHFIPYPKKKSGYSSSSASYRADREIKMGQIPSITCCCNPPAVPRSDLKPGDHIYTPRGGFYYHHGIYVGDDMVIHLVSEPKKGGASSSSSSTASSRPGESGRCPKCGHSPDRDGGIIKTCLDCFLDGKSIHIFVYGVTHKPILFCTISKSNPSKQVMERTIYLFEQKEFGDYNVLTNNCEHFASYCKTGIKTCVQRDFWFDMHNHHVLV